MVGWDVSGTGDVDGDGYDDILVGGPDPYTYGTVFFFQGGCDGAAACGGTTSGLFAKLSSGVMSVSLATAAFEGQVNDDVGVAVSGAGDIDGDGYHDLFLGAEHSTMFGTGGEDGSVYVVRGGCDGAAACGGVKTGFYQHLTSGSMSLSNADVQMYGPAGRVGCDVSGGGDFNGDGLSDLVFGARLNSDAKYRAGAAFVVYGAAP